MASADSPADDGICSSDEPRIVDRADGPRLTRSDLAVRDAVALVDRHGSPEAAAAAEPALSLEDAELALELAERRPDVSVG